MCTESDHGSNGWSTDWGRSVFQIRGIRGYCFCNQLRSVAWISFSGKLYRLSVFQSWCLVWHPKKPCGNLQCDFGSSASPSIFKS